MSENYKIEKIGVTALCRISAKGGEGVYLYIPKNFAEVYGIVGADYAEVTFGKTFFKVDQPIEKASKVIDLRSRSKKEQKETKIEALKENGDDEKNDFAEGDVR